jgi:hypothetical protein
MVAGASTSRNGWEVSLTADPPLYRAVHENSVLEVFRCKLDGDPFMKVVRFDLMEPSTYGTDCFQWPVELGFLPSRNSSNTR